MGNSGRERSEIINQKSSLNGYKYWINHSLPNIDSLLSLQLFKFALLPTKKINILRRNNCNLKKILPKKNLIFVLKYVFTIC